MRALDDILDPAPALVEQPVRPVAPNTPQPPIQPGKFVTTKGDLTKVELQRDKDLYQLAVEAFEQKLHQHNAEESPVWLKFKMAMTEYAYACAQYDKDNALYDVYIYCQGEAESYQDYCCLVL